MRTTFIISLFLIVLVSSCDDKEQVGVRFTNDLSVSLDSLVVKDVLIGDLSPGETSNLIPYELILVSDSGVLYEPATCKIDEERVYSGYLLSSILPNLEQIEKGEVEFVIGQDINELLVLTKR